jgi:hypothetical protein
MNARRRGWHWRRGLRRKRAAARAALQRVLGFEIVR